MQRGTKNESTDPSWWMGILTRMTSMQKKTQTDEISDPFSKWFAGIDSQWIWNARLVFHARIAIVTAILFLFQMAILRSHHRV